MVRRAQLRRVLDGLLQQGPLRRSTASRCRPRSTSSPPRWTRSSTTGVTPLANAGAEYPLAQQYLYQLALSKADRSWVDDYELYKGDVDFQTTAWTYAADTFADWVKKGYIRKTSSGLKAEDAGVSFIERQVPDPVLRQLVVRPLHERDRRASTGARSCGPARSSTLGSGGNLWVVPKGAKNKDLAYDFIDITMRKEIQNLLGNKGGVPVAADPAAITDPKTKELIAELQHPLEQDGLAFYPDWPVAGFYDVLVSGDAEADHRHVRRRTRSSTQLGQQYDEGVADIDRLSRSCRGPDPRRPAASTPTGGAHHARPPTRARRHAASEPARRARRRQARTRSSCSPASSLFVVVIVVPFVMNVT